MLAVTNVSCPCTGGENGFNQAIELSAGTLANVKFVQVNNHDLIGDRLLSGDRLLCVMHSHASIRVLGQSAFPQLSCSRHS